TLRRRNLHLIREREVQREEEQEHHRDHHGGKAGSHDVRAPAVVAAVATVFHWTHWQPRPSDRSSWAWAVLPAALLRGTLFSQRSAACFSTSTAGARGGR